MKKILSIVTAAVLLTVSLSMGGAVVSQAEESWNVVAEEGAPAETNDPYAGMEENENQEWVETETDPYAGMEENDNQEWVEAETDPYAGMVENENQEWVDAGTNTGNDNAQPAAPSNTEQQTTAAQPETTVPAVETVPGETYLNLLTGLKDLPAEAVGKRPVAVMINNHPKSYPQLNISQADVLFEVVVEHNLTRFMALFADYQNVPNLCSVRSYRYYFPAISNGFDAFYIHWGEDNTMMDYYRELNLDSYDGLSNTYLFGRDQSRLDAGYDLEHTSTFYGPLLPDQLASDGKRTDLDAEHQGLAFDFVPEGTTQTPAGNPCSFLDIQYGEQSTQLVYDPVARVYKKFANEAPQVDGVTGEQLAFTNAIILYTWITDREPVYEGDAEADRKWLDTFGVGAEYATGYYCSQGTVQKIIWYRENESDRFHFYDENGNPISINRGKTYITFTYFDSAKGSATVSEGFALQ